MIFPSKSDYPNNFGILERQNLTQMRLYSSLIEASASAYFESDFISRYFLTRKFYLAAALLRGKSFDKVLDAGTGIGFFIPYLSLIAKEVVGVERSEAVLYAREMAKKRHILNAVVDQYDLVSLPYQDGAFDCIVSLSTIDNFNEHELKIVFNSFRRLLKPNGLLLLGHSTENSFFRFLHNKFSFLFGKRLRTKQILDSSKIAHTVFSKPASSPARIEDIAQKQFGFQPIGSRALRLIPFFTLYRVTLFDNKK